MAENVCPRIDEVIKSFTDEDGPIVAIKKITDAASNREHYESTYENIKDTSEYIYGILHELEAPYNRSLTNEDLDKIVDKLEELKTAEKPLFDHWRAYAAGAEDPADYVLFPWNKSNPEADEYRDRFEPGFIHDAVREVHNSAWEQTGEWLYKNFPYIQKRIVDVVYELREDEWTGEPLGWL